MQLFVRARFLALFTAIAIALAIPMPAWAGHDIKIYAGMRNGADRSWVTVYRNEFSGMKREIVASGWMSARGGFSTSVYSTYHYFIRAQVHRGEHIVADTTVEIDPRHNAFITLVNNGGNSFHWQMGP